MQAYTAGASSTSSMGDRIARARRRRNPRHAGAFTHGRGRSTTTGMKFGLMYSNAGPFAFPEMLTHLATTAERVGVESIWAIEHVVIPVGYKSTYPYDPSGRIPAPEQVPMPDPLVALAYAAAVTKTLRLATGILILPQPSPLYVAKGVASLDVLSGGRLILGIGVGWLEGEFQALGIPFAERAGRTAETVRAMRSLWKSEPEPFEGKYFRWGKLESH